MPSSQKYVPIAESAREPVAGAKLVGEVDPNETFEITVKVRPRSGEDKEALLKQMESQPPDDRHYLSREEFARKFGADPADLEKVAEYAREHGLTVVGTNPAARTIVLRGAALALTQAFPTELKQYDSPEGRFRGRAGAVHVPQELQGIVEGVFGFDNRPQAKAH
jgi:kumamolisin